LRAAIIWTSLNHDKSNFAPNIYGSSNRADRGAMHGAAEARPTLGLGVRFGRKGPERPTHRHLLAQEHRFSVPDLAGCDTFREPERGEEQGSRLEQRLALS